MTTRRIPTALRRSALAVAVLTPAFLPLTAPSTASAVEPGAVPAGCIVEFGDQVRCTFTQASHSEPFLLDLPDEVRSVRIEASGARGGSALGYSGLPTTYGGFGMTAIARVPVDPDRNLEIHVGGTTSDRVGGTGGGGMGGAGDAGADTGESPGRGGGGSSSVRVAGSSIDAAPLVLGGGGGGAGGSNSGYSGYSGGDGGANAAAGPGWGLALGGGGTATEGGAAGTAATAGSRGAGGNGADAISYLTHGGGGGGGGWYGGGGGGVVAAPYGNSAGGSGGGGGSSYGPPGTHYVLATATTSGRVVVRWTDPEPPAVTFTKVVGTNLKASGKVSFTSSATRATFRCQVDSGPLVGCVSPFTVPNLKDGVHVVTVQATDGAGRVGQRATAVTVDRKAPNTVITAWPMSPRIQHDLYFRFKAMERTPVTFQCKLDAKPWKACESQLKIRKVKSGKHTMRIRAIDQVGNKDPSPASKTVVIR